MSDLDAKTTLQYRKMLEYSKNIATQGILSADLLETRPNSSIASNPESYR